MTAFKFCLNMEVIALKNAKEHIDKMTNNNMEDDLWCNKDALEKNLKNGWTATTSLCTYIESFLNSILRDCIGSNDKLRDDIVNKLNFIFEYYDKDVQKIKSIDCWEKYITLTKVRNELIHFKNNDLGYSGSIPSNWELVKKINIVPLFIKKEMEMYMHKFVLLAHKIADELNLQINEDVDAFSSDGHSHTYYIEPKTSSQVFHIPCFPLKLIKNNLYNFIRISS